MRRKNQNLTPDESRHFREIAEHHGYTASTGPYAGQGSTFALQLAIIHGDVALTSIDPDDRAALAKWLREAAPAGAAHLAELARDLAADLTYGLKAPEPAAPAGEGGEPGPINTLEDGWAPEKPQGGGRPPKLRG